LVSDVPGRVIFLVGGMNKIYVITILNITRICLYLFRTLLIY
jgi:hypothetical protein